MIHLATFADKRTAKAFADYLHVQGIDNQIVDSEAGAELSLYDANRFDEAKHLLDQFVNNPNDKKFLDASWQRGETDNILRSQTVGTMGLKSIWRDSGFFVRISTMLMLVIYGVEVLGGANWLYQRFSFPASAEHFELLEIYRLITPALMHGSPTHLVFNLFWWFWLGGQLEKHYGAPWLLNLFLLSAVAAHALQYVMENPWFLGLSGVVYGLLGYAMVAQAKNKLPFKVPNGIFIMMLLWLVIGFTGFLPIPMANWAHLGGLIAGIGYGLASRR
ncbi:rhomboid family intramembrane serine protease GlpG [Gayadomonas joobiniege]|uniref:rhomboid family intramembrane serine protease GlpG n=1 Tax=Gayadomonas joobiniege TaxID=1234606 RepID=UPI00037A888B|nr:rhomboid family intramembrane serine protease GlpG [Gayadomonas joobiniege]